jgi:hypothetical protein
MQAIKKAYPSFKIDTHKNKAKFRTPDSLNNASEELKKILPDFSKIISAKEISHHLDVTVPSTNKSISFNFFLKGIITFFELF